MEQPPLSSPAKPERISDLMRQLLETASHGENISFGRILHIFGVRGFAFLILILSLLNIIIFMLPFVSLLFGLPMIILAVQMILGLHTPIFPHFIRHRTINRERLVQGLEKAISWVQKLETTIKPRAAFLSSPKLDRIHGCFALILAIMVAIPIPLFNLPPSAALVLLAVGMLQRDGLFITASYALGFWCLVLFKSLGHFAQTLAQ